MAKDETLFNAYYNYFYKSWPEHQVDPREDILCRLVSGRSDDPDLCKDILQEFRAAEERRKKVQTGGGGGGGNGWWRFMSTGKPKAKVPSNC